MATHSSVLAWRIPGTGEPGGLPSMGSHRVGHDWGDLAIAIFIWVSVSPAGCVCVYKTGAVDYLKKKLFTYYMNLHNPKESTNIC